MRSQGVKLVPAHLDVAQRSRHTDLADDGVEDVAQVCGLGIDIASAQNLGDDGVVDEELANAPLSIAVGIVLSVELTHGRQEDAACFTVSDAQWTEL